MREIFTALKRLLTMIDGLDEPAFLVEIMRHKILHELIGIASLPGGRLGELRFKLGSEVNLHSFRLGGKLHGGKQFLKYYQCGW